jgi:DeoR/GlpR family transcriptional regulator of sugar metabolism
MEKLRKDKSVKVSTLMELFNVSIETVRRDLEFLEKEGLLKRVHGGAILDEGSRELTFTVRETKNMEEKREIAEIATRYVSEGQSIALDVSTTNTEFAKELAKKFKRLTILTNSLPIANELSAVPNFTVILAGGVMRNEELCIVGDLAEKFISQFRIDTFFMSMSGISLTEGLTDYGIGEVQIKKQMLECSQKAIVLADSSKFDSVSLLRICDFDRIDKIVTDSKIKHKILEKYTGKGIEIINQ